MLLKCKPYIGRMKLHNRRNNGLQLSFMLGDKLYATYAKKVVHITDFVKIKINSKNKIPETLKGSLFINGRTIPVIDVGLKLGIGSIINTRNTRILLLGIKNSNCNVGILVDSIKEILKPDIDKISLTTKIHNNYKLEYICVYNNGTKNFIKLFDLQNLLSVEECSEIKSFYINKNTEKKLLTT